MKIFKSLYFAIHPGKSVFILSQVIEYLDFVINSVTMTVSLTESKQNSVVILCDNSTGKCNLGQLKKRSKNFL